MLKKTLNLSVLFCLLVSLLALNVPSARAAETTYTVDTALDDWDGSCSNGDCSLRDAIDLANANASFFDTINIVATGTLTLSFGQMTITDGVQINGPGASSFTINANGTSRIFQINNGAGVNISGMELLNGYSGGAAAPGGGIYVNNGSLTFSEMRFIDNAAGTNAEGGAIYVNAGEYLSGTNFYFYSNYAGLGGGAIYADTTAYLYLESGSLISNGIGATTSIQGGALYINGSAAPAQQMILKDVYFTDNTSLNYGGAVYAGPDSNIKFDKVVFNDNHAGKIGGALDIVGSSGHMANVVIEESLFYKNDLTDSAFGRTGAAISTNPYVNVSMNNTTVAENDAGTSGAQTYAGGIYFDASGTGTFHIKNSIIANNTANNGAVCYFYQFTSILNSLLEEDGCGATSGSNGNIVGSDPMLDSALSTNIFGDYYLRLLDGSPAVDAGDNTTCALFDLAGISTQQDGNGDGVFTCDMGSSESASIATIKSTGGQDGWILESTETGGVGGSMKSKSTTLLVGDDASDRQYRSILSFATGSLPDTAQILSVELKFKSAGVAGGGNPISKLKGLVIDVRKGIFSTKSALQLGDFKAGGATILPTVFPVPTSGWYAVSLNTNSLNLLASGSGLTQIRLRFKKDDNDNLAANYLKIHSGDAASDVRPQLFITYYAQ